MAAPVKNYTAATSISTIDRGPVFPIFYGPKLVVGPKGAAILVANVMIYNPYGFKYAFKLPYFAGFLANPILNDGKPLPVNPPSYMLANTFPAAYTVTKIRPNFGQIWPRSGFLPPF